MKKIADLGIRMVCLIVGCFCMALGSQLAVVSRFGADVVILVLQGFCKVFSLNMGSANFVFSAILLLFIVLLNRRYIGFGTIAGTVLQSILLNVIHVEWMRTAPFIIRIALMLLGIVLISIGCAIYAYARLGVGPYVGTILACHDRFRLSVTKVKFRIDVACVVLALLMGILPSLGPVVSILISGVIMDATMKLLERLMPTIDSVTGEAVSASL